jgi:beta-lactamase class A
VAGECTVAAVRLRGGSLAVLVAALLAAAFLPAGFAAAQEQPTAADEFHPWTPDTRAADSYIAARRGVEAYAVVTPHGFWGLHSTSRFHSASVLKAMLLVAYLDRSSVRHRALTHDDRAILHPMITRSDNGAANRCIQIVGTDALRALARRAHMHHFTPAYPVWGNSIITASDQAHFFYRIDRYVTDRHRDYAMHLLASITPSQRWGIGQVAPEGWKLYFKGGWGSGTGLVDHQVALLRRGDERVGVAVLTRDDGSHEYGKDTLEGIFRRLLRNLSTTTSVR